MILYFFKSKPAPALAPAHLSAPSPVLTPAPVPEPCAPCADLLAQCAPPPYLL